VGIISWIVLGGIAGWIASMIAGRNDQMGCITNIIVGIIGGVLGGWIMSLVGSVGVTGFNLRSFLVALAGAVVLLFIVNLIWGRARKR
jgi:uncharacterized membrane protein YeaQ/YmgE (transglycosylase-associated protein family)